MQIEDTGTSILVRRDSPKLKTPPAVKGLITWKTGRARSAYSLLYPGRSEVKHSGSACFPLKDSEGPVFNRYVATASVPQGVEASLEYCSGPGQVF